MTNRQRYYSGFKKSAWWRAKRRRIYTQQNGVCAECEKECAFDSMQLHHIVPRSEGGRDVDLNLKMVCGECHRRMH